MAFVDAAPLQPRCASFGANLGRKKDHSVSDSTPSTSAVLLDPQQQIPEQSSVDDILQGDDIAALHIQQDQLSKVSVSSLDKR